MEIVLYLAEAFLAAYLMRSVSHRLKIPAVSGYVIGGVLNIPISSEMCEGIPYRE